MQSRGKTIPALPLVVSSLKCLHPPSPNHLSFAKLMLVDKTRMAALVLFVFARPDTVPESPASRLHIICKYLTGKYKERGLP